MTDSDGDSRAHTSTTLLEGLRSRQPQAWRSLVEIYGPLIYEWCRHCHLSPEDAADVVQEVFRKIDASVASFRAHEQGSLRGWMWTITRNAVRDLVRSRKNRPTAAGGTSANARMQQIAEPPDSEPPSGDGGIASRVLQTVRGDFEERTWQAFWQMTIENRPAAEVAAELNMSAKSARQAKYRVLQRVRQELQDLDGKQLNAD